MDTDYKLKLADKLTVFYFLLTIVVIIVWIFLISTNNKYHLREESFNEIEQINLELKKISNLEGKLYSNKDELLFEIKKIMRIDIYNKLYNKYNEYDDFFINEKFNRKYKIRTSRLINLGVNKTELDKVKNNTYEDKIEVEDIIMQIYPIITYENIGHYIDYDYETHYILKNIEEIMLPKPLLSQLKTISNVIYNSQTELEQAAMEIVGVQEYNKYSKIISSSIKRNYWWITHLSYITLFLFLSSIISMFIVSLLKSRNKEKKISDKIEDSIDSAKNDVIKNPKLTLPMWELANSYLQKYYNENIKQIKSIYRLSLVALMSGFLLILTMIILKPLLNIEVIHYDIGIIAGIITEFIGATFLFIYKSTIRQGLEHSKSLNQINNIGMAIKILESVETSSENKVKIEDAKISISKELISINDFGK